MVADKVNMLHAIKVVLDESNSIPSHFFHMKARAVQSSRLQWLLHVLELFQNQLLDALVEVFKVAVPAGLEIKTVRR